ncbi:ATP-binding protein [Kitasatospora sp. NBC_01539]|uniref:ATP-binding protein n=1 Tax=Kitasatospora sp. NBC_01539 TaxID=2903577 RepID=UPI00386015EE
MTGRTGSPLPAGQIRRLALYGAGGAVQRCRDFTREALYDWGWLPTRPGDLPTVAEDVLLMVSELVTNACLHAGGPRELTLQRTADGLRVEVADNSLDPPRLRTGRPRTVPGGHGLLVVDRLSTAWGSEPGPVGKTVWLEVGAPVDLRRG